MSLRKQQDYPRSDFERNDPVPGSTDTSSKGMKVYDPRPGGGKVRDIDGLKPTKDMV